VSYTVVTDFKAGMDRRRSLSATNQGSVYTIKDGHITRGGDIEGRKTFYSKYALPAGTFGLWKAGGDLYVFGSAATPAGMPAGVNYQRLQHPDGIAMSALLDADLFNGKIYAIAKYSDDSVHHFYDGARVEDWDAGIVRTAMVDNSGIATHLASLINYAAVSVGVVANVITITATVVDTPFTITAETVNVTGGADDQTLTVATPTAAAPAVAQVSTVTVGGTFEVGDSFSIIIDNLIFGAKGKPTIKGTACMTHDTKIYALCASLLQFCAVNGPTLWDTVEDTGAGFINVSNHDSGSDDLAGIEVFQNNLTPMARRTVQVWNANADPDLNTKLQTIKNTGSRSHKSVISFGDLDVFYLSDSGIRSLRARASLNTAAVNDVGTLIDDFVKEQMDSLSDAQITAAVAVLEPGDDRYWLALGNVIFVFSYFPGSKISAWSYYEPGFTVSDMVQVNDRVYARSDDTVYLYGGDDNATYDSTAVEVQLPFMSAGKPANHKIIEGVDIDCEGTWDFKILVDPRNESRYVRCGTVDGFTYNAADIAAMGDTTHFAPKLVSSGGGYKKISSVAVHFEGAEQEAA